MQIHESRVGDDTRSVDDLSTIRRSAVLLEHESSICDVLFVVLTPKRPVARRAKG
jgi:hypothetical protein